MEPSIEDLKKNYETYSDDKLIQLATQEADKLRPEALKALKEIIFKRGIPEEILTGIDAQLTQVNEETLLSYCKLIRQQPCPICGSNRLPLNVSFTAKATSFIFITNYDKKLYVACPSCLNEKINKALLYSLILGWWGFPWGIIRTLQATIFNLRMKKQIHQAEASPIIRDFVLGNIGRIAAYKDNPAELQLIIKSI